MFFCTTYLHMWTAFLQQFPLAQHSCAHDYINQTVCVAAVKSESKLFKYFIDQQPITLFLLGDHVILVF